MLWLLYCQLGSSPGHRSVLHLWIWESGPPQTLPPLAGRGLSHVRYRRICPPLHDRLQIPQPLQGLQLPWATIQNHWARAEQWHSPKKYGRTVPRNQNETCKSINRQLPKVDGLAVVLTRNWVYILMIVQFHLTHIYGAFQCSRSWRIWMRQGLCSWWGKGIAFRMWWTQMLLGSKNLAWWLH